MFLLQELNCPSVKQMQGHIPERPSLWNYNPSKILSILKCQVLEILLQQQKLRLKSLPYILESVVFLFLFVFFFSTPAGTLGNCMQLPGAGGGAAESVCLLSQLVQYCRQGHLIAQITLWKLGSAPWKMGQ